tara:strand:- start:5459 stop:5704 length:246 start_codon:yes stop_codon:yes gene_type:complete
MKAEQILQKSANKNMKRWELNTFKITHPTLYKTIIEAINEALIIDSVVVPKGAFNCGKERAFGEERCKAQCKDCVIEYQDN